MKQTLLALAAFAILSLAGYLVGSSLQPVHAAGTNGCDLLGNAGNVLIMRCIDNETGNIVYANSAGMLVVAP